uniref:AlNc14C101G6027 protein n=1 Tax=Albugo laibachii Nc14 TaxID=890382 RepID=F0WHG4_9STRA|nr:AlNc14C101G6027 [Albugo laibachii Nc14]|eukprot:CCA20683.1 AlNc14C101G6027 [Albugo laibachii Nc14]
MGPKSPVAPPRVEGAQTTPGDRRQVDLSPLTQTAEAAARDVNHKILEALTSMQELMARLDLSQPKRKQGEHMKVSAETCVFQSELTKLWVVKYGDKCALAHALNCLSSGNTGNALPELHVPAASRISSHEARSSYAAGSDAAASAYNAFRTARIQPASDGRI